METITSVSKALQEYEHAGSFASAAAADAEDVALAAPAAREEPRADASAQPHVDEGREASPPRPVEATETSAPIAKSVSAEAVVGEERISPPDLVVVEAEGVEARVLDEPTAVAQESAVPKTVARAATPEIQVDEETRVPLSQGATGGKARMLELACTSWAATFGLDADSEDDEEATARHTLEREMTLARLCVPLRPCRAGCLLCRSLLLPRLRRLYRSATSTLSCRHGSVATWAWRLRPLIASPAPVHQDLAGAPHLQSFLLLLPWTGPASLSLTGSSLFSPWPTIGHLGRRGRASSAAAWRAWSTAAKKSSAAPRWRIGLLRASVPGLGGASVARRFGGGRRLLEIWGVL
jgi:hypothetical protein